MKIWKLASLALLPAFFLLFSATASAQAPNQQLGIHVSNNGAGLQYAITPGLQIGGTLAFAVDDDQSTYQITPWIKFLLEGEVNPLIAAGFDLASTSTDVAGTSTSVTTDSQTLWAGVGLQYYINRNVGVFGIAKVLELQFDPSNTTFGINGANIGIEWFFD